MKSIGITSVLLALLLASSLIFGQQLFSPGAPLGPMVNGTDFSGSWAPARFQDAGLGTAAGALVDYGGISLNDASEAVYQSLTGKR